MPHFPLLSGAGLLVLALGALLVLYSLLDWLHRSWRRAGGTGRLCCLAGGLGWLIITLGTGYALTTWLLSLQAHHVQTQARADALNHQAAIKQRYPPSTYRYLVRDDTGFEAFFLLSDCQDPTSVIYLNSRYEESDFLSAQYAVCLADMP